MSVLPDTLPNDGQATPSLFLAKLRLSLNDLKAGERRAIAAMLANPSKVPEWSTADVARQSGTSPATVVRACQRIGFRGYQHLRLEFARLTETSQEDMTANEDDDVSTAMAVFHDAVEALRLTTRSLDQVALIHATEIVSSARRVLCTASGFSLPPLQDAALRLTTSGIDVSAPQDVIAQQFGAHSLGPQDVCLAVSYSGANTHTLRTCQIAKQQGASVIAVTNFSKSPLADLSDVLLVTGVAPVRHSVDPSADRVAQMCMLHALSTLVAHRCTDTTPDMRQVVADSISEHLDQ